MDANGNKVHVLRQQFENYEKLDPPYSTVGKYSSPLKGASSSLMGRSVEFRPLVAPTANKNVTDVSATGYALPTNNHHVSSAEDTRRNGIYVSNSITLHHDLSLPKSQQHSSSSHKRRPMVLDLSQSGNADINFIDDDHSSLLLLGKGCGDELSITSSSSSTCVNLLNTSSSSTNNDGEIKEPESQAHTPTSSSSASSGSGYGKVKRSNAFRAKDVTNTVVNEQRFVNKSKMVLERVKSLDTAPGSHSIASRADVKGHDSSQSPEKSNGGGGGSPAQRAASLCVRTSTNNHPKASQIFDTKSRQNLSSSSGSNATKTTGGKAVNIVTPYQVSDIYSQARSSSTGSHQHPHNHQSNRKSPQEVEYAIPIVRNQRHSNVKGLEVSPPKVPPPPLNYPPSSMKDQIGLPGPDSTYSYLQQKRHLPYNSDEVFSGLPKGHGNSKDSGKQKKSMVILSSSNSHANPRYDSQSSSGQLTKSQPPPEKPPRTFLYDILTDRQTQQQQKKFTQAEVSNTGTGMNDGNKNNQELYGETSAKSSSHKVSDQNNSNTSQTGSSSANPKRQYSSSSSSSTLTSSTTSYQQPLSGRGTIAVSTATVRQTNKSSNGNFLAKNALSSSPLFKASSKSSPVSSLPSVTNNKNMSKNDNSSGTKNTNLSMNDRVNNNVIFAGNPHPPLVRSKTESHLLIKNKSSWPHPHRPSVIADGNDGGIKGNGNYDYGYITNDTMNKTISSATSNNYYINGPSHHHQSQNNLLNNQKLYDALPQSRSTNNLLKYNNRYPSNPGIYQAVSSSWKEYDDHGLPRANNSNNNFRYTSHVHPTQHHFQPGVALPPAQKDHRSNSCMYITDIDLEMDKGVSSLKVREKSGGTSVGVISNSDNSGTTNINNRCASDDRICERSKSEWALNHVHSSSVSVPTNALSSSGQTVSNGIRRNTVGITPTNNSGGVGGSSTGHPSLESTSSSNVSSNQLHVGNLSQKKPGIQQSIQNLVNQLFSAPNTLGKDATSTDSGIQLGSESLSSCDTPIGDSTTDTGDSDYENDGETSNIARQVVEARKGYVRRVSSIRVQELGASINRLIQNSKKTHTTEPLFECLLVVGLNRDPYTGVYHAYIRDKFPPNAKLPAGVEQFCFPDSAEWPCHEGLSAQCYTLAITDQRGSRKYGCCFRILPEGANICIPITYCVISSHRAIGFYREVLREITLRHGYSEYQKRFWMEELYKKQFPSTGGSITITEPVLEELYQSPHHHQSLGHDPSSVTNCYSTYNNSPPKTVSIKRRSDHRLDEGDLVTLLTTVDLPTVIKIFGSLLLERKVVLISRALSTLSLCMEALESMLYPFSWQHTFVPILPLSMTDVLDAPAPFLIGVLRSTQNPWDKTLDEGIVVDLDQNKVISCIGDEATILPKRIHRKLRDALQLALTLADQKESTKNVLISECFIRMFVETMGHHSHHIVVQQDGLKLFERESFVKASDSKALQNFLEWFSETSMFHEFTQLRLKNTHQHGLFEQRVMEQYEQIHSQPNGGNGTPLSFKNAKLFTRPFGNWLKETFVK